MQDGSHILTARDGSQYVLRRYGDNRNCRAWRRDGPLGDWVSVKTWPLDAVNTELGMDTHGTTVYAIGVLGHSYVTTDAGATWTRCDTLDVPPGAGQVPLAPDRDCWGLWTSSSADHCRHGGDGVTVATANRWGADHDQDPVQYLNQIAVWSRWHEANGDGHMARYGLADVWASTARPVLKPFVGRDHDGRWRVGCHAPDVYREWRSTVPAWNDTNTGNPGFDATWVDVSPGGAWPETIGNLDRVAWDEARDGSQLLAGYHLTSGTMVALTRPGWGATWSGPYLSQAADDCAPYACCLPDGRVEVGWCADDETTWTRYRAATPDGVWGLV